MTALLHVLNGDATREKLERAGVPGDLTVWVDVFHDGPVPGDLSADEFRRVRARHLTSHVGLQLSEDEALQRLREMDAALERYREYEEVVFWFEHDLFDQLILVRHLHWLAQQSRGVTRFSLICIGEFPGVPNFAGLGQLEPSQLAPLLERRAAITDAQIELGRRAWVVFTGTDPMALDEFARSDTRALPFLEGVLRRYLEDFPGTPDSLSRSERQILRALDREEQALVPLFRATQAMEERIFMGDLTFFALVGRLAGARHPLIGELSRFSPRSVENRGCPPTSAARGQPPFSEAPGENGDSPLEITGAGRDVLHGRADHIELNGIDRWMGGVHLTDGRYRWDGRRLVSGRSRLD